MPVTTLSCDGSRLRSPEMSGRIFPVIPLCPRSILRNPSLERTWSLLLQATRSKRESLEMGNYNHFMTIQEMIDLVAFLKHGIDGKGK